MQRSFFSRAFCATSIVTFFAWAHSANALPVEFNLLDNSSASVTDEIESGTIVRDGITATLTPIVEGSFGELNQGSSHFGINADGGADVSNGLDGKEGAESITITFDVDVNWLQLNLSLFSAGEKAALAMSSYPSIALADTGAGKDEYQFNSANYIPAGSSVVLSWVGGNGFSFDSFIVEPRNSGPDSGSPETSVPDSGSALSLLAISIVGCFLLYRPSLRSQRA